MERRAACRVGSGALSDLVSRQQSNGHYDPRAQPAVVRIDAERARYWIGKGAQPSDRVARFLDAAGVMKREKRNNPEKAVPRKERKAAEAAKAAGGAAPAAS